MKQIGMEFQFPPDHGHLRVMRKEVRTRLDALGLSIERVDMVLLVLDEIVTNSIEHANDYRGNGQLRVQLHKDGDAIVVEFEDPDVPTDTVKRLARAFDEQGVKPAPHSERGRGLFLLAGSFEELSIEAGPGGGLRLRGRVSKGLA